MRASSKVMIFLACSVGILVFTVVASILWNLHRFDKIVKPYISYTRLVNLAYGMDDYKQQHGQWPTNIAQLVIVRPDLANSTTDAYTNTIVFINFSESAGYGALISYGRDGKPGGDNKFDRDIEVRFPTETPTNTQWNAQIQERFKNRADRGLP